MSGFSYLATPYSDLNPLVRAQRYAGAVRIVAHILTRGITIYSAIAHFHPASTLLAPLPSNFWRPHNMRMLRNADQLFIGMLPDWERSVGVAAEIAFAAGLDLPIKKLEVRELFSDADWEAMRCDTMTQPISTLSSPVSQETNASSSTMGSTAASPENSLTPSKPN